MIDQTQQQHIFNKAMRALRKQGCKSASEDGLVCLSRDQPEGSAH